MKLKTILLLAALLFIQLPFTARAASYELDWCGTPFPGWWWGKKGPPKSVDVVNWHIEPSGPDFRISFDIINLGATTFEGGMAYALSQAVVDPSGHPNPGASVPPADPRALLGTELLARGTLPTLRPGESTRVYAFARGFRTGANHILTVAFLDGAELRLNPEPTPWYWLNFVGPSDSPASVRPVATTVEPVSSTRVGYTASRVRVTLQNVGRADLDARTPILMTHGSAVSALGLWNPEDPDKNPNHPGNPYAIVYREVLYRGQLGKVVRPGESVTVEGTLFTPEGPATLKQIGVKLGE